MKYTTPVILAKGIHEIKVVSAKETTSKNLNPMIELGLRPVSGGPLFSDHLILTESAMWKVKACFTAVGEELEVGQDIEAEPLVGKAGKALVTVEEYRGVKRNKIVRWLTPEPPSAPESAPENAPENA